MFKDILVYVEIDKPFSWEKPLAQAIEFCQQCGSTLHVLNSGSAERRGGQGQGRHPEDCR
ncbi:MAG: hypothetical protein P8Z33_06110 [Gammaproteobacteria bacterium]